MIVSRGELVEIGGGFRIPDVIQQGGARLVEVGATNRTRLSDYAQAIGPRTRMLLRVHQSNYRITGFTGAPAPSEIAALAHEHGLLMMDDLGSGSLHDLRPFRCPPEPTVREAVAHGADVVAFSGRQAARRPAGRAPGRARGRDRAPAPPPPDARGAGRQDVPRRAGRRRCACTCRRRWSCR